ncbi:MAG TPA: PVC-type heme-binding CxxCH protein [Verrucomicrobiales bacterium]|jgi:mono/diheme cytochrome c family protein/glucose/arabinose dehydrogenase|nr:PVC-type heme-binding CxxCH protein [Verrucomicrobiales bacterium]
MTRSFLLHSVRFLTLAGLCQPVCGLNEKNAGPQKVEIKFNLPPPVPLSPDEALKAFTIESGYRIELVAAEPMVEAPVAISWDDQGRLYVVEMRGYMHDVPGSTDMEPFGRIKLLQDTDGDGRMDKADVFLDGLVLPRSVMAVNGGVLVGVPPQLLFCKDTDGDGKADVKEVVAADFGSRTGQPEHMANTPVWAMDNSVWSANWGTSLRFRAGAWTRGAGLGRGQYGLCQDDTGRLYYNYNSDLLRCDQLPADAFARNPLLRSTAGVNVQVLKDQSVWPAHPTPGVNRGYEPKTLRADGSLTTATATCGALIYRGDALPACRGNAFIPEPSANLVKRAVLTEKDGMVTAANPVPGREFLTSTDERFRPVEAMDGPDGALYLVDMYRGIIQHAGFLTHYLVANIEARKLALPLDRGRIWRIVPEKGARGKAVKIPAGAKERAALLSHASGWVRDTAQRLLVESSATDAAPPVVEVYHQAKAEPLARLHALWTLDGLSALTPELLREALHDADARVRAAAVRIAGREFTPDLIALAGEKDALVRAHLAIKLSALAMPEADSALAALLAGGGGASPLVREAALTGLRGREAAFGTILAAQKGAETCGAFFETLGTIVSTANKGLGFDAMLTLAAGRSKADAIQTSILKGLSTQANPKQPKLAWLDKEAPALGVLRPSLAAAKQEKLMAALDARIAWPGKPGAPEPPKIIPLTAEQTAQFEKGRITYTTLCAACHQPHGFGLDGLAPPLVDSEWVLGKADVTARIVLHGIAGPIKVGSRTWTLAMPPLGVLPDADIAAVLTYIRREWEHNASPVEPSEIAALRTKYKDRVLPWTAQDLKPAKR